jgi:hypothetical protein
VNIAIKFPSYNNKSFENVATNRNKCSYTLSIGQNIMFGPNYSHIKRKFLGTERLTTENG